MTTISTFDHVVATGFNEKLKGSVELQGTHTRGMLVVDKRYWFEIEKKNIEIINAVNVERVKELMKQAFGHE